MRRKCCTFFLTAVFRPSIRCFYSCWSPYRVVCLVISNMNWRTIFCLRILNSRETRRGCCNKKNPHTHTFACIYTFALRSDRDGGSAVWRPAAPNPADRGGDRRWTLQQIAGLPGVLKPIKQMPGGIIPEGQGFTDRRCEGVRQTTSPVFFLFFLDEMSFLCSDTRRKL